MGRPRIQTPERILDAWRVRVGQLTYAERDLIDALVSQLPNALREQLAAALPHAVKRPERGERSTKPWSAGFRGGQQKSPLRVQVEAAGLRWEVYRCRRRRGISHEDAIAGIGKRRKA
jgi:hypothetical protein